ncbi:MAG: hypothetical protein MJ188_09090 [Treponema sp.]|nr:hypothetical protein [Treponema sp.]
MEYDKKALKACQIQFKAITKLLNSKDSIENAYNKLPAGKQIFTTPVCMLQSEFIKNWISKPYTPKAFSPTDSQLFTSTGLRVRSKSEIIIASILDKLHIPYRYEYPVKLGSITMHPDFYCLNTRTHKEYLWEHFGMMDMPAYVENFVQKMQTYNSQGFFPGKNAIFTFETKMHPLNTKQVENLIKEYLL